MSSTGPTWDPDLYERYKTYRDRPALDLLLQVPQDLDPKEIWDLGCGTGEHAAVLAARHPGSVVHGLDRSEEMLSVGRRRTASVHWVKGDVADWSPKVAPDFIFTNAALQWLPDHGRLFPRILGSMARRGVFACQIPISEGEPWYDTLREASEAGPWASKLAGVAQVYPTAQADAYYRWLSPLARSVDIWETRYLHVLDGEDPVVEWMSGTALRPLVQALEDPAERDAFLDAYRDLAARAFPRQPDGTTLFPFPRLFMIARRA
jgi:trans-aconitate 2-methyltransferase